jgi:hypothetical protein
VAFGCQFLPLPNFVASQHLFDITNLWWYFDVMPNVCCADNTTGLESDVQ